MGLLLDLSGISYIEIRGKVVLFELVGITLNISIKMDRPHTYRAGEDISEPCCHISYNMLSDVLFKHPATHFESLILSCR